MRGRFGQVNLYFKIFIRSVLKQNINRFSKPQPQSPLPSQQKLYVNLMKKPYISLEIPVSLHCLNEYNQIQIFHFYLYKGDYVLHFLA